MYARYDGLKEKTQYIVCCIYIQTLDVVKSSYEEMSCKIFYVSCNLERISSILSYWRASEISNHWQSMIHSSSPCGRAREESARKRNVIAWCQCSGSHFFGFSGILCESIWSNRGSLFSSRTQSTLTPVSSSTSRRAASAGWFSPSSMCPPGLSHLFNVLWWMRRIFLFFGSMIHPSATTWPRKFFREVMSSSSCFNWSEKSGSDSSG